jgi:hypothetical protein
MAVLTSGGEVPARYFQPGSKKLSPRSKGIRQGALLMLSTIVLVPLTVLIAGVILGQPVLIPIVAVSLFLGGLFRILYALMMEDDAPQLEVDIAPGYAPPVAPQFERFVRNPALPPAAANATPSWRPRPNTAEIYQPPSVTENTTRLLDKDEPKTR